MFYLAYADGEKVKAMCTSLGHIDWKTMGKPGAHVLDARGKLLKVQKGIEKLIWRQGPRGRTCLYIYAKSGEEFRFQKRNFWECIKQFPPWYAVEV